MDEIKFEVIKKISDLGFKSENIKNISKLNSNSPPSIFIGSKLKYPLVNVGILSPLEKKEDISLYDDAKYWANNNLQIEEVLKYRNNLLNSRFQSNVKDSRTNNKFIEIAKDIAISSKPVDLEIELKNKVDINSTRDKILVPNGMKANLKQAKIVGNIKINQKVDKIINDEIKSTEGINILYKNGIDEYSLSKILSVGVLGLKKNKKLVPTRWSITATDDTITKILMTSSPH